jgi:hypothetical protein
VILTNQFVNELDLHNKATLAGFKKYDLLIITDTLISKQLYNERIPFIIFYTKYTEVKIDIILEQSYKLSIRKYRTS